MAPEVVLRKLATLEALLRDLAPYRDASLAQVEAEHYKLERILELLATVASDVLFHLLAEQDQRPDSYRDAFRLAVGQGMLPAELGENLARAAAMRNVLVHLYDRIDYEILHSAIRPALQDFAAFVVVVSERLER